MQIRTATPNDAEELLKIYAPYVENTAISFEYTVPTLNEFKERIKNILSEYPYLVAIDNGKIIGYAYASHFKEREAYSHTVEVSIYIDRAEHGKGIGKSLYTELEKILASQNVFIIYACIAIPDGHDEHLSDGSVKFHTKMGYHTVGRHNLCGYKFGKWYSMIWMEKVIMPRKDKPQPFRRFSELK